MTQSFESIGRQSLEQTSYVENCVLLQFAPMLFGIIYKKHAVCGQNKKTRQITCKIKYIAYILMPKEDNVRTKRARNE